MVFALAGAHRTGKSTTAAAAAKRLNIPYVPFSTGPLLAQMGIDPVRPMDPHQRLEVQERTLELLSKHLDQMPRPGITDRTPLDLAAYMMAEVGMHTGDADFGNRVMNYVQRCVDLTIKVVDAIYLLRPLPVYEVAEGKPPPNVAYQNHVQLLIESLAVRLAHQGFPLGISIGTDKKDRIDDFAALVKDQLKQLKALRSRVSFH